MISFLFQLPLSLFGKPRIGQKKFKTYMPKFVIALPKLMKEPCTMPTSTKERFIFNLETWYGFT